MDDDQMNVHEGDMPDEDVDETPAFVDPNEVEEVQVDDTDIPMDDDDDDDAGEALLDEAADPVEDMAKVVLDSHSDHVYCVASFFDGPSRTLHVISGGGDDKAFLHKIGTQTETIPLSHAHKDSVSCAAFNLAFVSEDLTKTPKYAAVGAYDGAIVVYDPVSGAKIQELEGPSDVEFLCFHPKGGSVLLAGSAEDGTVWMYHLPTSKCMQVFVGHESGVTAGVFTPDGRWALSCSSDGTLRIWAPRTGVSKHVFRLGEGAGLTCLATNGGSDGQLVLVGSEDGAAYVCHVGNKKVVATLRHFELPSPHGDDDKQMELPMGVEAVGFAFPALNSSWCATGGQDGILKIWDLNTGQCRQVCRNALPEAQSGNSGNKVGGITRLQWHPSLPLVYTASADGVIRVWDARNGTLVSSFTGHTDVINDLNVEVLENNSVLISASDDNSVRVFEVDHTQALKS